MSQCQHEIGWPLRITRKRLPALVVVVAGPVGMLALESNAVAGGCPVRSRCCRWSAVNMLLLPGNEAELPCLVIGIVGSRA